MAPGKTHVKNSTSKQTFLARKKDNSGVKKAKNNSFPRKKLKERTLQQIEEVNKNFAAVHSTLIKNKSKVVNSKSASAGKQACAKIKDKKPLPSDTNVTQDELAKTLENIANL